MELSIAVHIILILIWNLNFIVIAAREFLSVMIGTLALVEHGLAVVSIAELLSSKSMSMKRIVTVLEDIIENKGERRCG